MKQPQKALVTGANGFIGSHLIKRLIKDKWEVHIIVRPQADLQNIKGLCRYLKIHEHDGTTENMFAIVARVAPTIVFHLASLFLAQHAIKDVVPLLQSNVIYATQLVEAMMANHINCLINTGTSWEHYQNQDYNPVCLYAATKQAFASILKYYVEAHAFKVITLKLFDTYGPGDQRPKLFNLLRNAACKQKTLSMSPGGQLIDLVFIEDVVTAYVLAAERLLKKNKEGMEEYALSSMAPIKLRELIKIYQSICGKKILVQWGALPYRKREVMLPWNKGKRLPGWRPKVTLEKGIKITLESQADREC